MRDDPCALIRGARPGGTSLRTSCANLRGVIDAGLHVYIEEYLAETEKLLADNDQWGFYKQLKGAVGLGGRKARSEQFIMDGNGTLLRDDGRIRERWGGVHPSQQEIT